MRNVRKIPTTNMSKDEWLDIRRGSIGGSDAGAIVGLSKWSSQMSVWAEKTKRADEIPDNEAMRIGRDLEDYVAKRWSEETGKKIKRINAILYNDDYPFSHANIDRWVVGENAGLECKTTSTLNIKQFDGVDFPDQYYAQCVHYMAVTGADKWYLAVLVFGKGFFTFELDRDDTEIKALMDAEADFWRLVESDTPPPADGHIATCDALQTIYRESDTERVDLFGRETLLDEYMTLKRQKDAIDSRIREIQNIICADIGTAERGTCGVYDVSWKTQERKLFQPKEFSAAFPQIDITPFYKVSKSRPFKVTENKQ